MNSNAALPQTFEDHLQALGGLPASRVRLSPPPGTATPQDLLVANGNGCPDCELVDGTLVEKAMGFEASVVAGAVLFILRKFVNLHRLGVVSGADGFFRLKTSTRGPDVAYVSKDRLPGGVFPRDPYPSISPNLVVEVLSEGNTPAEMARKRSEYFASDVQLLWIVDCANRTVAIYQPNLPVEVVGEADTLDGSEALPGFTSSVADFFTDLDIGLDK